ncbi:hypothetical protein KIV66_gp68 [Mycobacterium phage MyraDee]|uniref:Uncharacterized protein n=1 Tax=Mycobacterium phage MyraDee TaxID=2024303 RepID=A0A222Z0U4_9CAUD|nr:hypothetical protein KIV66_gp68 [Mycobacterium phage MyraDee]ASR77175.1 hypothetical protein SEA_MYRADEE_68 [Mycobacterium phage MyraDee]
MIAAELNGTFIDREIQFDWKFEHSRVNAKVWGYVREIHHSPDQVIVLLAGHDSMGDKTEFVLDPGSRVLDA